MSSDDRKKVEDLILGGMDKSPAFKRIKDPFGYEAAKELESTVDS